MGNRKWFHELGLGFAEFLFPPQELCPICQREAAIGGGLGNLCLRQIAFIAPPSCICCGRPQRLVMEKTTLCTQCIQTCYYFSQARSVALYEGALREYLSEFKYRYRPELGLALGELLVEWAKLHRDYFKKINIIIPIPIHSQKMAIRGYNQAELLANPLQRYLGIYLKSAIIIRDKITESQNSLHKEERFCNISGAFRLIDTRGLPGARVLLVDDILTTGATVSEAARILLRGGAKEVKVLTLASGVIDSQWFGSEAGGQLYGD